MSGFSTWQDPIWLLPFGEALLAGEADWVDANGIDRGHGGLRLSGRGPIWRWNDQAATTRFT